MTETPMQIPLRDFVPMPPSGTRLRVADDHFAWERGDIGGKATPTPSLPPSRHNKDLCEINPIMVPLLKSTDKKGTMDQEQRLAAVAEDYGLGLNEARIALRYAKASKEATQRALTATPDEAKRVRNVARLWSLTLDLCLRLKVAATLPRVLVDERQYHMADQLQATFKAIHKLEKTLFGEPRTEKNDLIKKAGGQTTAWWRAHQGPETPTTPHPSSGGLKPTHFAA